MAFLLSLTSSACATTHGLPASAADANPRPAGPQMCVATAAPRVVASRVFVPEGVQVQSQGDGFAIRFAHSKSKCLTLEASSAAALFAPSRKAPACPEPAGQIAATSDGETMLASETGDANTPRILLGVVTYDVPLAPGAAHAVGSSSSIAWHVFQPPSLARTGETNPKLVPLGEERFLLMWVEGDVQRHQLRAQPVAGWGSAIGPAVDLSTQDMDVIGSPSAAVGPNGEGLVAFLSSSEHGFDVMATPIACGQASALQARANLPPSQRVADR